MKKTKQIHLRVSESFKRLLETDAALNGKTCAEYLVGLVLDAHGSKKENLQENITEKKVQLDGNVVEVVCISLPPDIKNKLVRVKQENHMSVSSYVRKLIMDSFNTKLITNPELDQLIRANNLLRALGKNLNQFTRKANSGDNVTMPEMLVKNLIKSVNSVEQIVKQTYMEND